METVAVIARLKPGTEGQAAQLLENGPPFDPEGLGLRRHRAFLSAGEVVFVFEGHQVEWIVDDLVSDALDRIAASGLRVQLARRFHNDATREVRRVRAKRSVRLFRLWGYAELPEPVVFDDELPPALTH